MVCFRARRARSLQDLFIYSADDSNAAAADDDDDDGSRRVSLEPMALPADVDNHKSKRRSVRARLAKAALPKSLPPSAAGDSNLLVGAPSSEPAPVPLGTLSGGVPSSFGTDDSGRTTGTWLAAGGVASASFALSASCDSLALRTVPPAHSESNGAAVGANDVLLVQHAGAGAEASPAAAEPPMGGEVCGALSFPTEQHNRSERAQRARASRVVAAALARSQTLVDDKPEVLRMRCTHAEYKCWAADGDSRMAIITKIRELQRAMTAAASHS